MLMPLSIFGFRALWSPWFLLSLVAVVLLYFLITVMWRHRFEGSDTSYKKSNYLIFKWNDDCYIS